MNMPGASDWVLHFLDARGRIGALRADVEAAVNEVRAALGLEAPSADIVIKAADWPMHPELAVLGASQGPGRIDLRLDTGQIVQGSAELNARLLRILFHEAHHLLR
ncbi:MAG: hypothetical protein ACK4IU_04335 [Tabrizicola flagellatus]|uniref:hypothetical protein n=1 Tax=Tabrizicola flagellatus TaxID=2593021 RepID=UPI00391AF70C